MNELREAEIKWLVKAHRRLLRARHDQAHNGELVELGLFHLCSICAPELKRAALIVNPPGAIPGLPVNWPSPSTNTPNVDTHPLEHYWSDREPLDAPWSDANGDEIERGDVTLP